MKGHVLITGASSGIGYELSKLFAKDGYIPVILARDKECLKDVASELKKDYGSEPVIIAQDLSEKDAAEKVFRALEKKGISLNILVNNAGFGGYGRFDGQDINLQKEMISTNITSLVALTRLVLPGMVTRKQGKILNVASMAGMLPLPYSSVYSATKAFVLSFSQSLREELRNDGITVSCLAPGPIRTNFDKRAKMSRLPIYRREILSAEDAAKSAYSGLMSGKDIIVPSMKFRISIFLMRFIPQSILISLFAKKNLYELK